MYCRDVNKPPKTTTIPAEETADFFFSCFNMRSENS